MGKSYLLDRSVLLDTSCTPPYLSDPVVLRLYRQGKVTHEELPCPPRSNGPAGTGTLRWASVRCLPDSKTLGESIYRSKCVTILYFHAIECTRQTTGVAA